MAKPLTKERVVQQLKLPGRQHSPPPVAADLELQSAVRARLSNILANSVSYLCSTMFSKDRSWVSRPKHLQKKVVLLMTQHVVLAGAIGISAVDTVTSLIPSLPTRHQNWRTRPTWLL